MILLENLLGQDRAVNYLKRSRQLDRLSNGYLLVGPEGTGKALAAKGFIAELLCAGGASGFACGVCPSCARVDRTEHPDMMWISSEKSRGIKIDDIRKAVDFMNLKPYESKRNLCVIENAHFMTIEASNALLKLLEEPPGESLVILISDKREWLLPTIVSRCAEVRFNPLSSGIIKKILMSNTDISAREAGIVSCYAGGSAGRAMRMVDGDVLARRREVLEYVKDIDENGDPLLRAWDSEDRSTIIDDIEFLIMFLRDVAAVNAGVRGVVLLDDLLAETDINMFNDSGPEEIYFIVTRLLEIRSVLEGNINAKLVSQLIPGVLSGA